MKGGPGQGLPVLGLGRGVGVHHLAVAAASFLPCSVAVLCFKGVKKLDLSPFIFESCFHCSEGPSEQKGFILLLKLLSVE